MSEPSQWVFEVRVVAMGLSFVGVSSCVVPVEQSLARSATIDK